jgi:hypothetical protein
MIMDKKVKKRKEAGSIPKDKKSKASQESKDPTGFTEDVDFKKNLGCGG